MKELKSQINEIVVRYVENPKLMDVIDDDTDLKNELNIDSVDVVEIIVDIEEKFNIKIEDSEAKDINTYSDLVKAIELKLDKVKS